MPLRTQNDGNAHFDRRIASTYAIGRDEISPSTIAEIFKDCLSAIRSISSIDVCSIQLTIGPSALQDVINVTVQVNEGTGADYSLDKVEHQA